jgi:hypothetical protein
MTQIREIRSDETAQFVQWLYEHSSVSRPDTEIFRQGKARVMVAEDENGVIAYIPFVRAYRMDALAPQPDVDSERLKSAFYAMAEYLEEKADDEDVVETLVQPNDNLFANFLKNRMNYEPFMPEVLRIKYIKSQESSKCA